MKNDFHKYVYDLSLALHLEASNFVLYITRSHGLFKIQKYAEALMDLTSARKLF